MRPWQQVMPEKRESGWPTIISACSLLCRAYSGPLQHKFQKHVTPEIIWYKSRWELMVTSGKSRSQTGRGWLKSLWSASPILTLQKVWGRKSKNGGRKRTNKMQCWGILEDDLSSSQFLLRNIVSDRAHAQPMIGTYLKHQHWYYISWGEKKWLRGTWGEMIKISW